MPDCTEIERKLLDTLAKGELGLDLEAWLQEALDEVPPPLLSELYWRWIQ